MGGLSADIKRSRITADVKVEQVRRTKCNDDFLKCVVYGKRGKVYMCR